MSPLPTSFCSEFCSRRNNCLVLTGWSLLGLLIGIVAISIFITAGYYPCKYLNFDVPCPKNWEDGIFIDGIVYFSIGLGLTVISVSVLMIPIGIILGIYFIIKCTVTEYKEAKRRSEGFTELDIQ
jgi:ABC-type phosphate transport system permease subunit